MNWTDLLSEDRILEEQEARWLFEWLAPLIAAAPEDGEAIEAARSAAGRIADSDGLQAIIDWWLVITTGCDPATHWPYNLPDSLPHEVRKRMSELIEVGAPVPAARWLASQPELAAALVDIDQQVEHALGRPHRMKREIPVFKTLLQLTEPTREALRSGKKVGPFDYEREQVMDELRLVDVEPGSRSWRDALGDADQHALLIARAVELQRVVEPWRSRVLSPLLEHLPEMDGEEMRPLERYLLRPILSPELAERDDDLERRLPVLLGEVLSETSEERARVRLARIADSWTDAHPGAVAALESLVEQDRRLAARLAALADVAGDDGEPVDLSDVELLHLEGDLGEMETRLDELDELRRRRVKDARSRSEFMHARDRLAGQLATIAENPALVARVTSGLSEANALLESDGPVAAMTLVEGTLQDLRAELTENFRRRLLVLRADFERLDDTEEHLARIHDLGENSDGTKPGDRLAIEDLHADLHDLVVSGISQAATTVDEIDEQFEHGEVDLADEFGELRPELQAIRAIVDDLRSAPELDGYVSVRARLDDVAERVARLRVHAWRLRDGEAALIDHVVDCCTRELRFDPIDVKRLYVALKTKPFAILAGLSGTGKSTIVRLFAEAFGATRANRRFARIAVRPDWIDQSEVLGYINPLNNQFQPGWLADLADRCRRAPDGLHVALLDEMNLAPVEQYFAEYLSAAEEARSGATDVELPLYSEGATPDNADRWPAALPFPNNLLVVGTVNVDETTRVLSARVLDRANVIQLSVEIDDDHHRPRKRSVQPWNVPFADWRRLAGSEPTDIHHQFLVDITGILHEKLGIGVGIRSHIEIEQYVGNAENVLNDEDALDFALLQRLIPKIRGFKRELKDGLALLRDELDSAGCGSCCKVIDAWLDPSRADEDYLDGTAVLVGLVR